ncbi:MAG TPA: hypothetical protein VMH49_02265 [Thermoplasmata archaeon]|nr:hypothetical protein [Thermoplasmata archaeon]
MNLGHGLGQNRYGGAVLDSILGLGIILIGAFLLYHLGLTFQQVLRGAGAFFGIR